MAPASNNKKKKLYISNIVCPITHLAFDLQAALMQQANVGTELLWKSSSSD